MVPVVALAMALIIGLPGAMTAKMPCMTLESWPIGPQLVSPSALRPTSIRTMARTTQIRVIHTGMPSATYCMAQSATISTRLPPITQLSGNSSRDSSTLCRLVKVLTSIRQRSSSEVRPLQMIIETAGHISQ